MLDHKPCPRHEIPADKLEVVTALWLAAFD